MNNTKNLNLGLIMESICTRHNDNSGSTSDVLSGVPITVGFAVGIYGVTKRVHSRQLSVHDLSCFLSHAMYRLLKDSYYIGTWYNERDGYTYIDAVSIVEDETDAIALGIAQGQSSIYNLATQETVKLHHES